MADNLGSMAWLFLQGNEQVQYLQKIALRAENPSGHKYVMVEANFLRQQFSAAIEAAHFPAAETGLLSPPSPAIFTFLINNNLSFFFSNRGSTLAADRMLPFFVRIL